MNQHEWRIATRLERRCAVAFIVFDDDDRGGDKKRDCLDLDWNQLPKWLRDALWYR